jgi:hypothetical protein
LTRSGFFKSGILSHKRSHQSTITRIPKPNRILSNPT